ncbi:MAG: universal stress protein [Blastocatellia bacterium]
MKERKRILIACDGSVGASLALGDLKRAGLPDEADALALSVAEMWLAPLSALEVAAGAEPMALSERIAHKQTLALRAADQLRVDFPGWEVSAEACCGSPASQIIKRAAEWGANLVVAGASGLSVVERLLLGSVSQKLLHDAHCSVRIGRGEYGRRQQPPERILIGFDGSVDSWTALREAAARRWPQGIQLRLLTAIGLVYSVGGVVLEVERWRVREEQQRAEDELTAADFIVSSVIAERDPKQALLEEADAWKADAIFLGTSGMGLVGRLVLGSVSAAIAARANCSVEVVRGAAPLPGTPPDS